MTVYHLPHAPEGSGELEAFCRTPAATEMLAVLDWTVKLKSLGAIVGAPGVGKTTVLRQYADDHRRAVYCVMSPAELSMSKMLRRLADALGLYTVGHCSSAELHHSICEGIRWDRPHAVMIDEAQYLGDDALAELCSIHDDTGVPMAFAGNEGLRARAAACAPFVSRIGPRADVMVTGDDIAALAAHYGIADGAAIAWLREVCGGIGGLRVVGRLLAVCRETGGGEVSLADMKGAALVLGGGG